MDKRKPEEILSIIKSAIDQLPWFGVRSMVTNCLTTPRVERRFFATDGGEAEGDVWIFLIVPGQEDLALAYSDEGYGEMGICWGLVFAETDQFGSSGNWYLSLEGLLQESGYFAIASQK